LLLLAICIVGVTNYLLQVGQFIMWVSTFSIVFMTLAIAGLAIGFGTAYPQFETENAAQIPTSFGGLLFMMAAVVVIGGVVVLEARPVYSYLSAQAFGFGTDTPLTEMVVGFGLAAALCVASTLVPIAIARRKLDAVER